MSIIKINNFKVNDIDSGFINLNNVNINNTVQNDNIKLNIINENEFKSASFIKLNYNNKDNNKNNNKDNSENNNKDNSENNNKDNGENNNKDNSDSDSDSDNDDDDDSSDVEYKEIDNDNNTININGNKLFMTFIGGVSKGENTILYTLTNDENLDINEFEWNVCFANANMQNYGDYIKIKNKQKKKYLGIILLNGLWKEKKVINNNTCCIKVNKLSDEIALFCIDPKKSKSDVNESHFILNKISDEEIIVRCEDWFFNLSDNDFNDVVLLINSSKIKNTEKIIDFFKHHEI